MHSCIYEGIVSHRRRDPVDHQFKYRLYMVYLDLDELHDLTTSDGLIGTSRKSACSFVREDHLFNPDLQLASEVRSIVEEQTGQSPNGPIRLLTQLRYFGYYMSPLNLYYCFDANGETVEAIVAEVNNTPWKERHCYVLWTGNRQGPAEEMRFSHSKDFHVSPFMDMNMAYRWRLGHPENSLKVHLANMRDSEVVFEAGMSLKRRPLNRAALRRMTLRYPMMTVQICAAIYFQALKLWWKKCPFYSHPTKQTETRQAGATARL